MEQSPGNEQPATHTAGQIIHLAVCLVGELEEIKKLPRAALSQGSRHIVVTGVDPEVLDHGHVAVQGVVLGNHTHNAPHHSGALDYVKATHLQMAGCNRRDGGNHAYCAALASAVGAKKAEALLPAYGKGDPVHGGEITESLGEILGVDNGIHAGIVAKANR